MITIQRAIAQVRGETEEKDTKTHQRRHVTIDPGTIEALAEHRRRWQERCAALELEVSPDALAGGLLGGKKSVMPVTLRRL